MTTIELSEYELKALIIVRDFEPVPNLSAVGFKLFEGESDTRKRNPSPQGMALAAGRFIHKLEKHGLVGHSREGRYCTIKGKAFLTANEGKKKC
jgi:hypothetical protein